jgi:putative adhesin
VCKAAANPADLAALHASLRGNELATDAADESSSVIFFLVRAPRGAVLDLHANNGEVSVHNVEGNITASTQNGPISLKGSSGTIKASAQNGPISFGGASSGTVSLSAQNGPITVKLDGSTWNGELEAHTNNGPLSVKVPHDYRSGVVVESDGHSPFSCRADACVNRVKTARDDEDDDSLFPRRVEFGSGPTVVRLSSHNGPVSVKNSD